ncbi:hypothetical protein MPSEU_000340200 [Mayamaea pseudoterrestris]|nr:hypothetical protein MPSEU_000340200 [Mayamaea pseudoterrestris]
MRRLLNCDKTNETNTQNMHLHVVHFDHQQRGASSDQDRELVQSLCAAYSVPLTCYYWNDDMQRRDATFTQATARSWRQCTMRELLRRLLQQERDQRNDAVNGMVLTAHHQNDSNETLLLKFLRGTHLTNLQGMPVISQLPGDYDGDDIVYTGRPLLHVTKAQLVAYLRANHFHWRDDDSNESPKYLRNRVRHELVPLLEDLVGGASVLQQKLDNLSQQSDEVNEYLMMRAHEYLKQCGDVKTKYFVLPPQGQLDIVHKHALFLWVRKQSKGQCSLDSASMERLCAQLMAYPDNKQWTINIGGGWDLMRRGNVMALKTKAEPAYLVKPSKFTNDTILTWHRQLDDYSPNDFSTCLRIKVPSTLLSLQPLFTLSSVKHHPKLTVTPTWRPSPIRLAAFLRGQGVPLHEQSNAPIIVLSTANESVLVAVLSKNEWVIDASFIPAANNRDEMIELKLK